MIRDRILKVKLMKALLVITAFDLQRAILFLEVQVLVARNVDQY